MLEIYLSQGGSYTTIKLIKYNTAMAEKEAMRVPRLWDRLPCLVVMPESCVTTQKAESLACEIARAPAPIASVVKTFKISVSSHDWLMRHFCFKTYSNIHLQIITLDVCFIIIFSSDWLTAHHVLFRKQLHCSIQLFTHDNTCSNNKVHRWIK